MSSLESKLSASLQSPKRGSGASKGSEAEQASKNQNPSQHKSPVPDAKSPDLNAGGGRGRNPERIWPD